MQQLLSKLQEQFPTLHYSAGTQFCWSPESGEIIYIAGAKGKKAMWSLLHETGHALLKHAGYRADYELVRLEVAAWEKAREIAGSVNVVIDEDHIQDCLDTYRDWLYKRSICPTCHTKCLQENDYHHYRCFNCHTVWRVTASRFARAYRSTNRTSKLAPVFHDKTV